VTPAYARLAETQGLELEVDVPGHAPRRVRRRLIISDFAAHLMRPGLVLPVYVNPRDPDDILVVW